MWQIWCYINSLNILEVLSRGPDNAMFGLLSGIVSCYVLCMYLTNLKQALCMQGTNGIVSILLHTPEVHSANIFTFNSMVQNYVLHVSGSRNCWLDFPWFLWHMMYNYCCNIITRTVMIPSKVQFQPGYLVPGVSSYPGQLCPVTVIVCCDGCMYRDPKGSFLSAYLIPTCINTKKAWDG